MKTIATLLFMCLNLSNMSFAQLPGLQWQKTLGGSLYDYGKEIEHTTDGGSIIVGYSESVDGDVSLNHGGGDCWIVKSDLSGIVQWKKTYGGTGLDYGYSIKQTADGYIVAGYSESIDGDVTGNHGGGDCWILKLNNAGDIQWQKTVGGTSIDNAQSVKQTTDGGYIICGYTESSDGDVIGNHGGGDSWILKLDGAGMLQWQTTLGGALYDFAQSVAQTSDGGYILTGGTYSADGNVAEQNGNGDCWLVKLDNSGTVVWENSFGGTEYDFGQSVSQTIDGGYVVGGYSESNNGDVSGQHGAGDCWVIKCNNSGGIQWQTSLGSTGNDYAYCIQQITSGGYILTGYSESNDGDVTGNHGAYDCWVTTLNPAGQVQLQRSFGGTGVDVGYSICEVSTGNYILAGYTESNDGDIGGNHGNGDCWILALNVSATGINESSTSTAILVSSTITPGNFNFSNFNERSTLAVYDLSGKMIIQQEVTNSNYILDLNGQSNGVYLYSIITATGVNQSGKLFFIN